MLWTSVSFQCRWYGENLSQLANQVSLTDNLFGTPMPLKQHDLCIGAPHVLVMSQSSQR